MFEQFLFADAQTLCAVLAAFLTCVAFYPYITDTIARRTQPQRSSWLIWSVLSSISLASQIAEGATFSLVFAGMQCAGTLLIFALSIFHGAGTFLRGLDAVVLLGAALGLALWFVTHSAVWALGISCAISLLGGSVTVLKAYRAPESETLSCWMLGFFASGFALVSIGSFDVVLMMYPAYLFMLYGAIILAMALGRTARVAFPSGMQGS